MEIRPHSGTDDSVLADECPGWIPAVLQVQQLPPQRADRICVLHLFSFNPFRQLLRDVLHDRWFQEGQEEEGINLLRCGRSLVDVCVYTRCLVCHGSLLV